MKIKTFKSDKKITQTELQKIKDSGRVVFVYPRKEMACVDGFQYFQVVA